MSAAAEATALASGKGHTDENFPVASWLIAPEHRGVILAFYRFARNADDVADHATASPDEKLARLSAMADTLEGKGAHDPLAAALKHELDARSLTVVHALDLLTAFRLDVTKTRYENWADLMDYCRYSAMPVGRFVLDVHGEDVATWPQSDAICAALQVINHLQDCGKDYRALGRIYLPRDLIEAEGVDVAELGGTASGKGLGKVIRDLAARTEALLAEGRSLPYAVADWRLGLELEVICTLAGRLTARLGARDPLADRVHHSKPQMATFALMAAAGYTARRGLGMPRGEGARGKA